MPQGLDARKAMIIGTAGFTAMLWVMALEDAGVRPQDGEIVVTGAKWWRRRFRRGAAA